MPVGTPRRPPGVVSWVFVPSRKRARTDGLYVHALLLATHADVIDDALVMIRRHRGLDRRGQHGSHVTMVHGFGTLIPATSDELMERPARRDARLLLGGEVRAPGWRGCSRT